MSKKRNPKQSERSAASSAAAPATAASMAPGTDTTASPVEDQSQRRLKYGANVAVTIVLVIGLAVLVIWLAQAHDLKLFGKHFSLRGRPDMTSDSSNTLKPQTIAIIRDLDEKVTLVSLYPKLKQEERGQKEDTYDRVVNILQQYHERSPDKISVEVIDPIAEPAKLDAWIGQLKRDYGKEIPAYEDLLRGFPKTVEKIQANADSQVKRIEDLIGVLDSGTSPAFTERQVRQLNQVLNVSMSTMQQFPPALAAINTEIKTELEKKIPDYEKAKNQLVQGLTQLSKLSNMVSAALTRMRDDTTMPQAVRDYATQTVPSLAALKGLCDDTISRANGLGKLKLDEVRRKLIPPDDTKAPPPAIVIVGKEDIRVIDFDSVWKSGATTSMMGDADQKPRLRFAGEQQITRAILALSQRQQKTIAVVRDFTQSLIQSSDPEDPNAGGGPMSDIAERLRSYNFKVVEKDTSLERRAREAMDAARREPENRQALMQAMQMQQMMRAEPDDSELKDAIWIVFPGSPGDNSLGERLKKHLEPQPAGGDLSIDSKDPHLVRSITYSFTSADMGRTLSISSATGWTAGRYEITSVVPGGAAHLDRPPGLVGSADAVWGELQGVDLTVDSDNNQVVRSGSHPFTAADKGDVIRIKPGTGWKPGTYKITGIEDRSQTAVSLASKPTAGTFTIAVTGGSAPPQQTRPLRFDAPAAEIQAALAALQPPGARPGNGYTVTGNPGGPWIIRSQGDVPADFSAGVSTLTSGPAPAPAVLGPAFPATTQASPATMQAPPATIAVEFTPRPLGAILDQSPAAVNTSSGAWDLAPGSAICLTSRSCDDLSAALDDYGLHVNTNEYVVHERIDATEGSENADFIERARRFPPIYVLNTYGDHPIAKPLNGLDSAAQAPLRVARLMASATPGETKVKSIPGVSVSMLLPVPETPRSWVESDWTLLSRRDAKFEYHETDIKPPFYLAAAAEREGCGKLVVLGGDFWVLNGILRILDPKMEKQHLQVAQFPGNGEFFTNSIFWLNGQDQMIALSPSAMDTARIASIGDAALNFWRIGIFLIGLPLASLAGGLFVYRSRRDR